MVGGVGNHRKPARRQFTCGDQACEEALSGRPDEGVAVLAVDLHRHDDAEQQLLAHGPREQAGYLRLTCCESSLGSSWNSRRFQGRAEGDPDIDELPHMAIDEHDVAALAQGQRGFSLALELGEVALAQRRRGRQCLQPLDLAGDLTVDIGRQSMCLTHQFILNAAELRVSDANSRVHAEQQERRNDGASEHDQQMPQRSRRAERGHRSDPQDDADGDAKQATGGRRPGRPERAVEGMDAAQVGEQGEHFHAANKAAERRGGEVIPFEAAERERTAREREPHRHPVYHTEPSLRSRHSSLRHQQAVQVVDAEIDTESIDQIEHSDGNHREASRECQARVLAGVHKREAEGCKTQGRRRFHGCEAQAPARRQR